MDNDNYGRTVSVATADGVDTYTIVDTGYGNFTFTLPFPTGTALYFVYSIINQYEPQTDSPTNGGAIGQDFNLFIQGYGGNMTTGNTSDRTNVSDQFANETGVGFVYFDQTLGKPIWYVGWGPTGWIDATGTQV